jgi:outer membrane biosynthesis protein TonB
MKALLFVVALVGAAVLVIAGTAALAVLILFLTGKPTAEQNSVTPLLPPVVEDDIPTPVDVTLVEETLPPTTEPQQPVEKVVIEEKITKESPQKITKKQLNDMTIPQLKQMAKEKGVYIKSSLRKPQIIELLSA